MSMITSISDRMKQYESVTRNQLMRKQPVIIRLDGKCFHTFTKGFDKPFDKDLSDAMEYVCIKMKDKVQNTKFIYSQSDEISILMDDRKEIQTTPWLNNTVQKIVSISASMATMYFNEYIDKTCSKYFRLYNSKDISYEDEQFYLKKYQLWKRKKYQAQFDSRAFNLPLSEVTNYFIFRNRDAIRNSKQSLAQCYFSNKQLNNIPANTQIQMVLDKIGIDYNQLSSLQRQGFCIYRSDNNEETKWIIDKDIPDFVVDRNYIEKHLEIKED